MRLYASTVEEFYDQVDLDRISDVISSAYKKELGRTPPEAERRSWRNSLLSLSGVCRKAGLDGQGIIVEYQLPQSSKRLDVLITGADSAGVDRAEIIELKQWQQCEPADGEYVVTWVAGRNRDVLHPSVQVGQYHSYLSNGQSAFHEGDDPVQLGASAFLHNYEISSGDALLDPKFSTELAAFPVYSRNERVDLIDRLGERVGAGPGNAVLDRVLGSSPRPSKKLLATVARLLEGHDEYTLLDEQLIAFDRVLTEADPSRKTEPAAVLIHGGPGTGKSVIALNLLAELSRRGLNAQYATGSRAFTENLRKFAGRAASQQFRYFHQYAMVEPESVDVLICDESHRIRETSVSRFTRKDERSGKAQIEELIDASRTTVFLIDDLQVVRPKEVGSSDLIHEACAERGRPVFEYHLAAQFRCAGSEGFISWVTDVLDIEQTATPFWEGDPDFDFRIVDSPDELEAAVVGRVEEGESARLVAGYCWEWSDPLPEGTLVPDIVIGDWSRPWNAKSGAGRLAKGVPKEHLWATDPGGIHQVGCIYTAQGFEFDYVGVIVGPDLVYREGQGWLGVPEASHDRPVRTAGDDFVELAKNTYRVLLTRGMKGCAVYFTDRETREYWKSRVRESIE